MIAVYEMVFKKKKKKKVSDETKCSMKRPKIIFSDVDYATQIIEFLLKKKQYSFINLN